MSTSTTPDGEQVPKNKEVTVEAAEQFLKKASDYFQSEMKCMLIRFSTGNRSILI